MIELVPELQAYRCTACGEMVEILRKWLRDPDAMLRLKEALQEEHKVCEEYADRPHLISAAREVARAMKREFSQLERRKAA